MIKEQNELQLFKTLKNIIDPNLEIKRPKIIIKDHCECDMKEDPGIFDILGYFSYEIPDSIFLCKKNIEKYCEEHKQNIDIVSEIIYLHETAHYLHFHINGAVFEEKDSVNTLNSKLFFESFAQLLTHKAAQETSYLHFEVFEYLKHNQPFEYILYNEVKSDYKIPLSVYPKEVIFDLFLNSSQIGALMGSAISMLESWIKKNPNPKLDFHQEEIKRLFDLGLLDPESCFESYLKSYLKSYKPFIEKNI